MSESFDKKWKYIQKYISEYIFIPKNKPSNIGNSSKLWNTLYQQKNHPCAEVIFPNKTEDEKWNEYNARWAICQKHHPPGNVVYYDINTYDECPRCKKNREKIEIEFLQESDVML